MSIHAATNVRCYNHPHRSASRRCSRCATSYCDECLVSVDGQLLCPSCRKEIETARQLEQAEWIPLGERVRGTLTRIAFWVVIIGIVCGAAWFFGSRAFSRPLTQDELNRIRDAFEMQMGDINWMAARRGAKVLTVTSEQPSYPASLLIDERVGTDFSGWRSTSIKVPQEIVFDLGDLRPVQRVRVMPSSDAPLDSWARQVEIFRSSDLNGPWQKVASAELPDNDQTDLVEFPVPVDQNASSPSGVQLTQYVKIVVLSNWGNAGYVSLGEVQASGM